MEILLYQILNYDLDDVCLIQICTTIEDHDAIYDFMNETWSKYYQSDEFEVDSVAPHIEKVANEQNLDIKAERIYLMKVCPN